MEFTNQMEALSSKVTSLIEHVQTEEATKNALIMPFLQTLGYDVFNPTEVVPEFIADIGKKKGEKVDYAIMDESTPIALIECKCCTSTLNETHASQLHRYFHTTKARIGILTNGVQYMFFSDLESKNVMDEKPFMTIDMLDLDEQLIPELKKLTKTTFELDSMLSTANNLKYTNEIKKQLELQLENPSPEFVKVVLSQFYKGMKTQQVIDHFTPLIKKSFKSLVSDHINYRLKSAFSEQQQDDEQVEESNTQPDENNGVVTTEEELEGFMMIRAILRGTVDISRVQHRDTKSYFGILLDDNNRKPICRLHFNTSQKYITVFDENRKEIKHPIESLDDIYNYTDEIRRIISVY